MEVNMRSIIFRALGFVRHLRGRILVTQFLMVIASLLGLAMPLILGEIFDAKHDLAYLIGLLLVVGTLAAIVNYFKTVMAGSIGNDIALTLRNTLFAKLQKLPQSFYAKRNTGDILSTVINDINLFKDALSTGVLYIAEMLLSFVAVVVIMLMIDPLLTWILLIALPLIFFISRLVSKPVSGVSRATQMQLSEITDVLNQSISGMEVIKSYSLQQVSGDMFQNANTRWYGSVMRLTSIKSRSSLFVSLLNMLEIVVMIGFGFLRVQQGAITIGELTSFVLYSQALAGPVGMLTGLYVDVKAALAAMRRVFGILDLPEEQSGRTIMLPKVAGNITFDRVSFEYENEDKEGKGGPPKRVLNGISLDIKAGQKVALVGESGAGKTTMINLILGFFRPSGGRIRIDGVDLDSCDLTSLRDHISVVSQNPYIFDLSFRDNIRCGNPFASEEEIIQAAKNANAHGFISESPCGYDTVAGEKGLALSGGQRQRIAIARAFLKDAPILLLDEATSALDNFSELAIKDAIDRLMKGRTTITVAHRLSTIINSDVIFYIKNGQVLASGNHSELLSTCEEYRRLYNTSLGNTTNTTNTSLGNITNPSLGTVR